MHINLFEKFSSIYHLNSAPSTLVSLGPDSPLFNLPPLNDFEHIWEIISLHLLIFQCEISKMTTHCCCSVAQVCLTLNNPKDCSMPGLFLCHIFLSFLHFMRFSWQVYGGSFAIPSSSGSPLARTLHYDMSILGGPTQHGS